MEQYGIDFQKYGDCLSHIGQIVSNDIFQKLEMISFSSKMKFAGEFTCGKVKVEQISLWQGYNLFDTYVTIYETEFDGETRYF